MINFPKIIVETLTGAGGGITNLVKKGETGFRPDVPPPQPPDNPSGYMFEFSTHNDNNSELPIALALMPKDNNWTVVDADTGELLVNAQGAVSPEGILVTRVSPGEATPYESFMIVFSRSGGGHRKYKVSGKHYQMGIGLLEEFNPGVLISKGSVIVHRYLDTNNKYFFAIKDANLTVPLTLPRHITDLGGMFAGSNQFNQDLSRWDTSQVTTMNDMFSECTAFNQDISKWDVSNVTNMNHMFSAARAFNQDLSPWCVKKIPNKPTSFDSGALRWSKPRPQWGTCPGEEVVPPYVPPVVEEVDDNTVIKAFDFAVIRYIWTPTGGEDLDTRTYLTVPERTGRKVGWKRLKNDNGYLIWNEDETDTGVESVLIDLDKIHTDYPSERFITARMDGFWFSQVKSGNFGIEFTTFKGGKMVAVGHDWINEGGRAIQILKLGVNTLVTMTNTHATSTVDIEGEHLATLRYDTLLKKGTLIAREGPSSGNGDPEVPVIPSEGGGNGPGGIVDPNNPVYPDSEQEGFTFSVKIIDNDGGSVPFDIRLVKVAPGWKVYSGNTLILSADKTHPQVNANTSMGDVTLTFNIPRKDIKTYTIIADATSLAFEVTQTSFSGQDIVINRFSRTISNHQFSVTDAILRVPTVLPSYITSTFNMFLGANQFNQDISMWDTSNVTNMSGMFDNAETFNQDISGWDVSNVTNMMFMFRYAHKFNQPIGSWNVKNVTNMKSMFESAPAFNQDLSKWCVRKIATKPDRFDYSAHALYTSHLPVWGTCPRGEDGPTFYYTRFVTDNPNSADGSELGITIDLKKTGGLWQAIDTLTGELLANQDGGKVDGVIVGRYGQYNESTTVRFNRTGVSTKQHISLGIVYSSDSIRIRGASVEEGVYYPPGRVFEITEFSPKIWNYQLFMRENVVKVPSVLPTTLKNCEWLFGECYNIVTDLSGWDTSHVYNTAAMFVNCKSFNQDISKWDVSNVAYMRDMFSGCTNFNQDLSPWSVVKQPSKPSGFDNNCNNWVKPKPVWGTMGRDEPIVVPVPDASQALIFTVVNDGSNAAVYTNLRIEVGHLGKPWQLFEDDRLIASDTYNEYLIARQDKYDMRTLVTLQDRANSTHQYKLFMDRGYFGMASPDSYQYESTTSRHVALEQFSPTIYKYQFRDHTIGNLTVPSEIPPVVREAEDMFRGCTTFNSDISGWDVSRITVMSGMFYATSSFNQDLSPWNVSSIRSKPSQFDDGTDAWTLPKPVWGTVGTTPPGNKLFAFTTTNRMSSAPLPISLRVISSGAAWSLMDADTNAVIHKVSEGTSIGDNTVVYLNEHGGGAERRYTIEGGASEVNLSIENEGRSNGFIKVESFSGDINQYKYDVKNADITVPLELPAHITSTEDMFAGCNEFNQDISHWDMSNITNMKNMFKGCVKFNQDISGWDVGKVETLEGTFEGCVVFDQDLSRWSTISNTSLARTFAGCSVFNSPLNGWDTSNVTTTVGTFENATVFNQPLDNWNTLSVTEMGTMFSNAVTFNQNINAWSVSNVTDMQYMFKSATSFNQPLNHWNTHTVFTMESMFQEAHVFDQDISMWDVSRVYEFNHMFNGALAFNQPLNSWVTTSMSRVHGMFNRATSFNQPLDNWKLGGVNDSNWMSTMFSEAESFNQDLSSWCVAQCTYSPSNFSSGALKWSKSKPLWGTCDDEIARTFNFDISTGDVESNSPWKISASGVDGDWALYEDDVVVSSRALLQAGNVKTTIGTYNTLFEITLPVNVEHSYRLEVTAANIEASYFDDRNKSRLSVFNLTQFSNGVLLHKFRIVGASLNVPSTLPKYVRNLEYTFAGCSTFNQDLSGWDVSNVTNFTHVFEGCTKFNSPLNTWDMSNAENVANMFQNCSSFDQPLSNWVLPKIRTVTRMFSGCSKFNQDISMWNVSNIWNFSEMFRNAAAFNSPLANWDMSNASNLESMFYGAAAFNQPIGTWDIGKVTNMNYMFSDAYAFNQPLNGWNTINVKNMEYMFERATTFNQNLSTWNVLKIAQKPYSFDSSTPQWILPKPAWGTDGKPLVIPPMLPYDTSHFNILVDQSDEQKPTSVNITLKMHEDATDWEVWLAGVLVASPWVGHSNSKPATVNGNTVVIANRNVRAQIVVKGKMTSVTAYVYPSASGASLTKVNTTVNNYSPTINSYRFSTKDSALRVPDNLLPNITSMTEMFKECTNIVSDITGWDTSNVLYASNMFNFASKFNQDLSKWNVSKIPSKPSGFDDYCSNWVLPRPIWGTTGKA